MLTYCILLVIAIALLYVVASAMERAREEADRQELRRHVIRMEGRQ